MILTKNISKRNYNAFLWHTAFFSIASSFMDVDTIMPSMMIQSGGNSIHLGFLTAIMLGSSTLFQLLFASFLSKKKNKRFHLLFGVYLRVLSLFLLGFLFLLNQYLTPITTLVSIFMITGLFSISGSYAGVSYVDIMGKSIMENSRKKFFSVRLIFSSLGMLLSSFLVRYLLKIFNYPVNYSYLFFIASLLLFIASLGFWRVKEPIYEPSDKKSLKEVIRSIPKEIKENKNLKYYIILMNISSLYLSTLPFLIMYAKENFGLTKEHIGDFLILRVVGAVLTSFLLVKLAKSYKFMLKLSFFIGGLLPLLAIALKSSELIYPFLFMIAGISIATLKITKSGILLEISNNENRALYTGITGATNLITLIFPIISGTLIANFSFEIIFISVSLLVLSSLFFVDQLKLRV